MSEVGRPNPAPAWLTDKAWVEIVNLSGLKTFAGFAEHFADNLAHYKQLFDSNDAHEVRRAVEGSSGESRPSLRLFRLPRSLGLTRESPGRLRA